MNNFYRLPVLLLLVLFLSGCNNKTRLEQVLEMAGSNRAELEKVLEHYSCDEGDSLRLRAAIFLIENIPGHYSLHDPVIENYKSDIYDIILEEKIPESAAVKILTDKYGYDPFEGAIKKYDILHIDSDYLIRNIDHAFMVWQTQPWGNDITFDVFCNEILPYRIADEPLQEWRQAFYDRYQPLVDSLYNGGGSFEAMRIVYETIHKTPRSFLFTTKLPRQGGLDIFHNETGNCIDVADRGVYIMRSLGIPGTMDMVLKNPGYNSRHFWNSFSCYGDLRYEFELYEVYPIACGNNAGPKRKKGIVYRQFFAPQPDSPRNLFPDKELPRLLDDPFIVDVTDEYFPGYRLDITIDPGQQSDDVLYLCVHDGVGWGPVAVTAIDNGKASFPAVEFEVEFQPAFYIDGKLVPMRETVWIGK